MKTKTSIYQRTFALAYVLLVAVLFVGCVNEPKETEQNGNFQVEYLFEQNGCKMYRFKDGTRYVYWSDCQGKVSYDVTRNSGKSSYIERGESLTTE